MSRVQVTGKTLCPIRLLGCRSAAETVSWASPAASRWRSDCRRTAVRFNRVYKRVMKVVIDKLHTGISTVLDCFGVVKAEQLVSSWSLLGPVVEWTSGFLSYGQLGSCRPMSPHIAIIIRSKQIALFPWHFDRLPLGRDSPQLVLDSGPKLPKC